VENEGGGVVRKGGEGKEGGVMEGKKGGGLRGGGGEVLLGFRQRGRWV